MMRLSLLTLVFPFATLAMAAEGGAERFNPMSTQTLLETSGGLLLILLLIFAGAWLFRRYAHLPMAGKRPVNILGGVSVGPRERVVLLQVEDTRLLVGVAPGQVRTLHVLGREEPQDESFQTQLTAARLDDARG